MFGQIHHMLVDQPAQHIIYHTTHANNHKRVRIMHHFLPKSRIKVEADLCKFFPQYQKGEDTSAKIADQVIADTNILVIECAEKTMLVLLHILWNDAKEQYHYHDIHHHSGDARERISLWPVLLAKTGESKRGDRIKKDDGSHPGNVFRMFLQIRPPRDRIAE